MGSRTDMRLNHLLPLLTVALALLAVPIRAIAVPTIEGQLRQCATTVVLELEGVPRSEVLVFAGEPQPDGMHLVRWQTQQGHTGFCIVRPDGTILQFEQDAASVSRPRSGIDPAFLTPGQSVKVTTAGGALNLRHSPAGEVTGSAENGSILVVTGQTHGEWVEVDGGQWVSRYHLSPMPAHADIAVSAADSEAVHPRQATVVTAGNDLNVRDQPNGNVVSSLPNGTTVRLTGRVSEQWAELETGGWVSRDYLQ